MKHALWLFFVKYFTSYQPAIVAGIDTNLDTREFELPNGQRIIVHPGQWKLNTLNQHVLLETLSGSHYFMYKPISKSDYEYLTR